ncbi:amidase family protein [Streptomyces niveus]|uniref:amidase family protein n=1 Tax=Streptomyces niveus TaxID=193462 RepID=UPI0034218D71
MTHPTPVRRAPHAGHWPEPGPAYDHWEPPTPADIAAKALHEGFALTVGDAERYADLGRTFVDVHKRVARRWLASRPVPDPLPSAPGDDEYNAVAHHLNLRGAAEGPLSGTRIVLKSTIAAAPGAPIEAGSLLVDGHRAPAAATVATRALDAGAEITCTGCTDNLCLATTGDTGAYGPVLNPWNRSHTTWGSSAGPAALVTAGEADAAIMVDQAGSGRTPAAGTGLVSLMPTAGLIPMTGIVGFTPRQDRVAVASRHTRTVALLSSTLSGGDGRDLTQGPYCPPCDWASGLTGDIRGLRVGVVTESLTTGPDGACDDAVAEAVWARVADLARLGAEIYEVSIPDYAYAVDLAMLLTVHGGAQALLASQLGSSPTIVGGDPRLVKQFAQRRAAHPEWMAETVQVSAAVAGHNGGQPAGYWLAITQDQILEITAAFDAPLVGPGRLHALLTPTVHSTPPALAPHLTPDERLARALGPGIRHTCVHNLTGRPAITIPAGLVNGLPVAVQLSALSLGEQYLLNAALALEPENGYPAAPAPYHDQEIQL